MRTAHTVFQAFTREYRGSSERSPLAALGSDPESREGLNHGDLPPSKIDSQGRRRLLDISVGDLMLGVNNGSGWYCR
jgi:hypothetical protein